MSRSLHAPVLCVTLVLTAVGVARPGEPPASTDPASGSTTDDALLRSLLGEEATSPPAAEARPDETGSDKTGGRPANSPDPEATPAAIDPVTAKRLLADLKTAEKNLANGETGQETRTAQSNVIAELDRLIEAAKQQQSESNDSADQNSPGTPQPQPSAQPMPTGQPMPAGEQQNPMPTGAAGVPNGPPQKNRKEPAEESSDRVSDESSSTGSIRDFRSGLVHDVWGHLPDRLRDQLLNVGSDRYLPEYDSLVRDYFESLARPQNAGEPRRP